MNGFGVGVESPDANGDYLCDYIWKVNLSGAAICQCNKKISHGNGGGGNALKQHAKKQVHINMPQDGQGSQMLPAVLKLLRRNHLRFLKLKYKVWPHFFIVAKKTQNKTKQTKKLTMINVTLYKKINKKQTNKRPKNQCRRALQMGL